MAFDLPRRAVVLSLFLLMLALFPAPTLAQMGVCPTVGDPGIDGVFVDPISMDTVLTGGTYVYDPVNSSQGMVAAGVTLSVTGPATATTTFLIRANTNVDIFGTLTIAPQANVRFIGCGSSEWGAVRIMPSAIQVPSIIQNARFEGAGHEISLEPGGVATAAFPPLDGRFPAHCVRLGRVSHTLRNCTFAQIAAGAIPVLADPNVEPLIENLDLPGNPPSRTAAIGFCSFVTRSFSKFSTPI